MTEEEYGQAMLAKTKEEKVKKTSRGAIDVEHIAALKAMEPGRYYAAADMMSRMDIKTEQTERKVSYMMGVMCKWELAESKQVERIKVWTLTPRGEKYAEMLR